MSKARGSRPAGTHRGARPKAAKLVGTILHFNKRSKYPVVLKELVREAAGTRCREAYLIYRPGAFDAALAEAVEGEVERAIRLQLQHDVNLKLCSTISGALELFVDEKSLTFRVRANSRDGRRSIRWAKMLASICRETSVGMYPLKFRWIEPTRPDRPGLLIVMEAKMFEVSIVDRGVFGGTFACVI